METEIRIFVIEGGFVFAARGPDPRDYPFWYPYTDRRTIRNWGTTEGLGQLCGGPTSNTKLDTLVKKGTVPVRAIIDVIESLDQKKWEKVLMKEKNDD